MSELTARSMIHGAALGNNGDADAAALLAVGIDNPALHTWMAGSRSAPHRPS
jgi:hypothetical protein